MADSLNQRIVQCRACPRLVEWREKVALEKVARYADCEYWGRAVPNFGDPAATKLIVGLAPAAHGANRTGRMFTGDRSGQWLYRALHRAGLANQSTFESADDGLALIGTMITAVCHCAPPDNKPTRDEILNCNHFLVEILGSRKWTSFLCLGGIAWREVHRCLGWKETVKFSHGAVREGKPILRASYHPSQQNTFTGRLTEAMFDSVIGAFARD